MRQLLLVFYMLNFFLVSAQNTNQGLNNTIWQHTTENYIYSGYYKDKIYEITDYLKSSYPHGGITFSIKRYGFYKSCELPCLDSLKQEGAYYFEVDSNDFADVETMKVSIDNSCAQLNIITEGNDTLMNIYYSSRQQYTTYKKVESLPKNVQEYLEKNGVKFGN